MRIALIQTPVWGIYEPPLSLSLLSACLKKEVHDVNVYDLNIELFSVRQKKYDNAWAIEQSIVWSSPDFVEDYFNENENIIDKYINKIINNTPEIVGISVNSASKISSLKIAALIKQKNKYIKIIFGGHIFMIIEEIEINSILNSGTVDFIVYGEGETTFGDLLHLIKEDKKEFNSCNNIFYLNSEGDIIKTERGELIKNLDELPFMDFSGFPLEKYVHPEWLGKHLTFQTSRGCPWKCAFCGATTYWPGYRFMSGKRIYEEIKFHLKNDPAIEHIEFMDLLFNGSMKSLKEFCVLIIENPIKVGLKWHANAIIRPEMTLEVLMLMKEAGCERITYGIESGSQKVLDLMKKKYQITDAGKVLKATHDAGILIKANFMFGFPGETKEDFDKTLEFIKENGKYITTAYPSFSFCVVESNSYLGEHMEEYGIIPNEADNLYWVSKDGMNTYPERLRRWELFSNYARELGVDIGIGLDTSTEQHRWMNLGYYYKSQREYDRAFKAFNKYLEFDPKNKVIGDEIDYIKPLL